MNISKAIEVIDKRYEGRPVDFDDLKAVIMALGEPVQQFSGHSTETPRANAPAEQQLQSIVFCIPKAEKQPECKHEWQTHSKSNAPMSLTTWFTCKKCGFSTMEKYKGHNLPEVKAEKQIETEVEEFAKHIWESRYIKGGLFKNARKTTKYEYINIARRLIKKGYSKSAGLKALD